MSSIMIDFQGDCSDQARKATNKPIILQPFMLYLSPAHYHPMQELAISSLLEIDLKEPGDAYTWSDRKLQALIRNRAKGLQAQSFQKAKRNPSLKATTNNNKKEATTSRRYNLQFIQNQDSITYRHEQGNRRDAQQATFIGHQQKKFNEGEYWSSKVYWMSNAFEKQLRSQPKLSKKISFAYEANSRQSQRGNSRNYSNEKSWQQENKTNLVYQILSGESQVEKVEEVEQRDKKMGNRKWQSSGRHVVGKVYAIQSRRNGRRSNFNVDNGLQENMRQTLEKMTSKSFHNASTHLPNPLSKTSELERAALVRQMLQSIENAKGKPIFDYKSHKSQSNRASKDVSQNQSLKSKMQPQQGREIEKKSDIAYSDLDSCRVFKGKTINNCNRRKVNHSIKAQLQQLLDP